MMDMVNIPNLQKYYILLENSMILPDEMGLRLDWDIKIRSVEVLG